MLIRTGILCCPTWDEAAALAVRRQLHEQSAKIQIVQEKVAPHQQRLLEEMLRSWCDEEELDLILTIGGTRPAAGPSAQERVPDATQAVCERQLPGIGEEMRALAREQSALALIDRSVAGIRGRTLLLNLPAGPHAASLFLTAIIQLIPSILLHLHDAATAPDLDEAVAAMVGQDAAPAEASGPEPTAEPAESEPTAKLDFAEFAAFLARKAKPD